MLYMHCLIRTMKKYIRFLITSGNTRIKVSVVTCVIVTTMFMFSYLKVVSKSSVPPESLKLVRKTEVSSLQLLRSFLRTVEKDVSSLELIVVEPWILQAYLTSTEWNKVKGVVELHSNSTVVTMVTVDGIHFESSNSNKIRDERIKYLTTKLLCYSESSKGRATNHIFCKIGDRQQHLLIHIVMMELRNDYFWFPRVSEIPEQVSSYINTNGLVLGMENGAVDRFSAVLTNTNLRIPSEPAHFLQQLTSTRFIECNRTRIKAFIDEYGPQIESYNTLRDMKTLIRRTKVILAKQLIQFWAMDGTLLGWHRQCGIIVDTRDVDFGMWSTDFNPDMIHQFDKEGPAQLYETLGMPKEGFQFREYGLDLFLMYKESDHIWNAMFTMEPRSKYKSTFPIFKDLCSAELLKTKILVPCEPERIIVPEYGTDWAKKQRGFAAPYDYKNCKRVVDNITEEEWKTKVENVLSPK